MSTIWPLKAKAPLPSSRCSSKAAISSWASWTSSFDGVKASLITGIWPGWMEIFPVNPIQTPS